MFHSMKTFLPTFISESLMRVELLFSILDFGFHISCQSLKSTLKTLRKERWKRKKEWIKERVKVNWYLCKNWNPQGLTWNHFNSHCFWPWWDWCPPWEPAAPHYGAKHTPGPGPIETEEGTRGMYTCVSLQTSCSSTCTSSTNRKY